MKFAVFWTHVGSLCLSTHGRCDVTRCITWLLAPGSDVTLSWNCPNSSEAKCRPCVDSKRRQAPKAWENLRSFPVCLDRVSDVTCCISWPRARKSSVQLSSKLLMSRCSTGVVRGVATMLQLCDVGNQFQGWRQLSRQAGGRVTSPVASRDCLRLVDDKQIWWTSSRSKWCHVCLDKPVWRHLVHQVTF